MDIVNYFYENFTYFFHFHFTNVMKLSLSLICGGLIGLERGFTKHSAGFRTHILVCLGSTLAMMTNYYIVNDLGYASDPARLGAQVITGVGFLGVGIIFVTGKHKIKGLTTAAGLWTSACIGLAIGIGFFSGAITCTLLVILALYFFPKLEIAVYKNSPIGSIYVELDDLKELKPFLKYLKGSEINVIDVHISSSGPLATNGVAFYIDLKLRKKMEFQDVELLVNDFEGVIFSERIR